MGLSHFIANPSGLSKLMQSIDLIEIVISFQTKLAMPEGLKDKSALLEHAI